MSNGSVDTTKNVNVNPRSDNLPWWGKLIVWGVEKMGLPCVFICIAGYLLLTKVVEPVVASHANFLKETVSLQRQQDIKIDSMVAAEKQALANHTIIIDNQSKIIRVLETISLHRPTDPYKLGPSQESTIPQ